jgi:hypothetical protein
MVSINPNDFNQGKTHQEMPRPKSILIKPGQSNPIEKQALLAKPHDLINSRLFMPSLVVLGVLSCLNLSVCLWIIKTLQLNSVSFIFPLQVNSADCSVTKGEIQFSVRENVIQR